MAGALALSLVTRQRLLVEEDVDEVSLPASMGEIGILPGHAALLSTLGTGELCYKRAGVATYLAVQHGFVEVIDDRVTVLADVAEPAEEIDIEAARSAAASAEDELRSATAENLEAVTAALRLAQTRVQVAQRRS